MRKTQIEWHQAIQISQEQQKQQVEKLDEFLTAKCDLFTFADFQHYAYETGKTIEWLKENASYSDPAGMYGVMLQNAIDFDDPELIDCFYLNQ